MKKIRVIWYKAKWGDGHWIDNAIDAWTWLISSKNRKVGPYSHVEIWTADEGSFSYAASLEQTSLSGVYDAGWLGTCWTSTTRGKKNGTVMRPANTVINNVARWDFAEIELDDFQYEYLIDSMKRDVAENKGYSKRDLWRFFLPFHRNDKSRDICSEFVNDNLYVIDIVAEMDIPSPRRLAWKLQNAGYEIKPLK